MKVLILGGYGNFGRRLVRLLADETELTIQIAGRSAAKATSMVKEFEGRAQLVATPMDRANIADYLDDLAPDLVVDASGPFQEYGDNPYIVPRACIDAHIPYIDLADGTGFVEGISALDAEANQAGVFVLSGMSTCPVLTTAVLDEMAKDFDLETVHAGIAPSPKAGLGLSVMRAVLGYAGAPVKLWRDGQLIHATGLGETKRFRIGPPGKRPLESLLFSLVDVPDLRLAKDRFPNLREVWFGAGPVPEIYLRLLVMLARLRGRFGLPSFAFLAPLFHSVLSRFHWGADRGGMFVRATGQKDGQSLSREWHMLAEGDNGPFVPVIPACVLIQKMLRGDFPKTGARSAMGAASLADYRRIFENLGIRDGFRGTDHTGVYDQVLGAELAKLPAPVQDLHTLNEQQIWQGKSEIIGSDRLLARIVARLVGFPKTGKDVPVTVTLTPKGNTEIWQRNFAGQKFKSIQWAGQGRDEHFLMERFGLITVALALEIEGDKLHVIPVKWRIFGVPLPRFLLPGGTTFETITDGKFTFYVTIQAPLFGHIVSYRGTLEKT